MKFNLKASLALLAAPFLLAGCSDAGASEAEAAGSWPEEITVVQYTNDENPNTPTAHDGFRKHMEAELSLEVNELQSSGAYATGIEAMSAGKVDVMLVSPQSYAAAKEKADAELFATIDQDTDYRTLFLTQADNDEINELADLEGVNFAFADPNSSSGYLYPKATLVKEFGLEAGRLEESGYFFENIAFSGGHDNTLLGVSMGDYEAGAVASTVFKRATEAGTVKEEDFKIVGESVDIPNASYVVRGDIPEDLKQAIADAFMSYDDAEYFETIYGKPEARFTDIDAEYYAPAVEAMRIAGGESEE